MKLNKYQKIGIISRYTEFKRLNFEESECKKYALQPYALTTLLKETAEKVLKTLIEKNKTLIEDTTRKIIFDDQFKV